MTDQAWSAASARASSRLRAERYCRYVPVVAIALEDFLRLAPDHVAAGRARAELAKLR